MESWETKAWVSVETPRYWGCRNRRYLPRSAPYRERSHPKREMHVAGSEPGGPEPLKLFKTNVLDIRCGATECGACPAGFRSSISSLCSRSSVLDWYYIFRAIVCFYLTGGYNLKRLFWVSEKTLNFVICKQCLDCQRVWGLLKLD